MKPIMKAESAPATPVTKLPSVKAVIFQRAMSRPKLAAASSSSRTASSATPTEERSSRCTSAKDSTSKSSASAT